METIEPLPTSPDALFALFDGLAIPYRLYRHQPVFRVADGAEVKKIVPGVHCRNLFLRDKRQAMFLVVAANETLIDLRKLPALIASDRLSFGSPNRLWRHLGVRPGSVCPFAILNDRDGAVTIVLDAAMMAADFVNYHPLDNRMSVVLTPADLLKFIIGAAGHEPSIIDLSPAAPATE